MLRKYITHPSSPAPNRKDETGQRFGRLTVVKAAGYTRRNQAVWQCLCDCGNTTFVMGYDLRSRNTKSCGCLKRQLVHGYSGTLIYKRWFGMLSRCYNPASPAYANYGGRGIRVCQEWHLFPNFLADMGSPMGGQSLDRKNNDGHYSCGKCAECATNGWPANCQWATKYQQARNKRSTRRITAFGKTMVLADWSCFTGISVRAIGDRLRRGQTPEQALSYRDGRRKQVISIQH